MFQRSSAAAGRADPSRALPLVGPTPYVAYVTIVIDSIDGRATGAIQHSSSGFSGLRMAASNRLRLVFFPCISSPASCSIQSCLPLSLRLDSSPARCALDAACRETSAPDRDGSRHSLGHLLTREAWGLHYGRDIHSSRPGRCRTLVIRRRIGFLEKGDMDPTLRGMIHHLP